MKQDRPEQIAAQLSAVPAGTLAIKHHQPATASAIPFTERFQTSTEGKGLVEIYSPFAGIECASYTFAASEISFRHEAAKAVLEIYYCRSGRVGWNMQDGMAIYLGAGDISLHSMDCCANSVMMFPLGYSEGISVSVDLDTGAVPDVLRSLNLNAALFKERFCSGKPCALPASPALEHIFAPLYGALPEMLPPLIQLKVQELLLYMAGLNPAQQQLTQYFSQQTELIKEVHRLITSQLNRRFTIEELAKRYLISTSTLKDVFKTVYGLPIATYMKEYRVRQAMQLLRTTDAPIAEIAAQVGYATQGKFTQAFKDVTHLLPTEYRKNYLKK